MIEYDAAVWHALRNKVILNIEITNVHGKMIQAVKFVFSDGTEIEIAGDCYGCLDIRRVKDA